MSSQPVGYNQLGQLVDAQGNVVPGPNGQPIQGVPSTLTPTRFTRWLDAAKARGVDETRLIAAGMAAEALEGARELGLSLLPPGEKLLLTHVIEIAKLICSTETALRAEFEVEEETTE